MNQLGFFYQNVAMKDEVKAFLIEHLNALALKRVYAKQDVTGIADAEEAIQNAFRTLDEMYTKVDKPIIKNKAR